MQSWVRVDLADFRGFPQRDSVDITVMPYDQLYIINDSNIT